MWLKSPNSPIENCESGCCTTNFIWKSDNSIIYISDNHLTAGWCWLQECNPTTEYNFFHIDAHNDLSLAPSAFIEQIEERMDLDRYLNSKPNEPNCLPYVIWSNFISLVASKYPQWFNNVCFSTQEDIKDWQRDSIRNIPIYKISNVDLACQIETVIENGSLDTYEEKEEGFWEKREPREWILSFDLDYFFMKDWDNTPQYLTDAYIKEIGKRLNQARNRLKVITIAISPECCKGWDNSFHILDVLSAEIPEIRMFLTDVAPYRRNHI